MEKLEILKKQLEGFNFLTPNEIEIILDKTILKEYKMGKILVYPGELQKYCYMVIKGCVRAYVLMDGQEKTTAFYTEGDKIPAYSGNGERKVSDHFLECSENCLLTLSNNDFEQELRQLVPRLDAIIQQVAIQELNHKREQLTQYIVLSPEERYKHLLKTKPSLFLRVPHHQIASFLGITPQSLSRMKRRIFEFDKSYRILN